MSNVVSERRGAELSNTDREHQRGEAAEAQIDAFIRHRAKGSTLAQDRGREWTESKQRYLSERAEAQTHQTITHHRRLAGVHANLADEHAARAERLADSLRAELADRGEGS